MTRVVEEETVMRLSAGDEPVHGANDVCTSGSTRGILLVIRENDHIVVSKSISLVQKRCQIPDIVDAPFEFIRGAGIIDTDQQRL